MKNVVLTFACRSWDDVERLIHDALMLERGTIEGLPCELTRVEVEK